MSRSDAEPVRVRLAASVDLDASGASSVARQRVVSSPASPRPLLDPSVPDATGTQRAAAASTDGHYSRLRDGVRRLRATARTFKVTDRTLLVAGGILAPVGILVIIIGWWGAAHSPFLFQQVPYLISGGLLGLALVILGSFLYFGYWLTQVVKEQRRQATAVVEAIERLERVAAGLAGSRTPARNGHTPTPAPEPGQPAALEPPPEARPTDSGTQSAPEAEWRSPVGSATQAASRASAELATRTSADIGRTSEDTATQAATGASTHTATQAVPGVVEQPNSELSPAKGPGASGDPLPDTLVTTPNEVFVATAKGTMAHHRDCVVVAGKTGLRHVTKADGLAACKLCAPYDA